ncbi:hypothetical protein Gogos_005642 [Gossypium gossypioides]|uniref:DUF4283 domain-containing protein n=1 Tax=Gossypium gossypioides TaxID=34282 RepID=A0A7J9D3D3_GOSGO|nr:hypothetical protein [Gossypium gossypioides]
MMTWTPAGDDDDDEKWIAELQIEDNEEEASNVHEDGDLDNHKYEFCLVGYFLIASVINFQAMRNTMANIWHPLRGVVISDLGEKRFLFRFYHELDIRRVENGAPWTFNSHLFVFHRLWKN